MKVREQWFGLCVWMFGVLQSTVAFAQGTPADDVLGPAAKIADDARLSPGWGIVGGIVVICVAAAGVGLRERKLLFAAGLILGGIILWYTGADIIKPLIPTSGTRMS